MLQGAARTSSASSAASRTGCLSPGNNLREANSYELRAQLSRLQSEHEHLSYYWQEAEKKASLFENEVLRLKVDADRKLQNFIDVTGSYAELKEAYGEANRRVLKLRQELRDSQSMLLNSVASSKAFHQKLQGIVSQAEAKFAALKHEASVIVSFLLSNTEIQSVRKKISTSSLPESIKAALEALAIAESARQPGGAPSSSARTLDEPPNVDLNGANVRRLAVPGGTDSSTAASAASNECGSSSRVNSKQPSKRKSTEGELQSAKSPLTLFNKTKHQEETARCSRQQEHPEVLRYERVQSSGAKSRKASHRARSRRREVQGSVRPPVTPWVDELPDVGGLSVEALATGRGKSSRKAPTLTPVEALFSRPGLTNSDETTTGLESLGIERLSLLFVQARRELDRRGGATRPKVIRSPRSQAVTDSLRRSLVTQTGRPSSTEQPSGSSLLLSDAGVPYNSANLVGRVSNRVEQPAVLRDEIERLPYKTREKDHSKTRIPQLDSPKADQPGSMATAQANTKSLRVDRLGLSIPSDVTSAAGPNRERRNARNMSRTRPKRDASRVAASSEAVINSHRSALERSRRAIRGAKAETPIKAGSAETTATEKNTAAGAPTRPDIDKDFDQRARQEHRQDVGERNDDKSGDPTSQDTNRPRKPLTRQTADRVGPGGPVKSATAMGPSRRTGRRSNSSENSKSDTEGAAGTRSLGNESAVMHRERVATGKPPTREASDPEGIVSLSGEPKFGESDWTPAAMLRNSVADGATQDPAGTATDDFEEGQNTGTRPKASTRLSAKGTAGPTSVTVRPGVQRHVTCPNPKTSKTTRGSSSLGSSLHLEDTRNPLLVNQKHRVLPFGTHERGATEVPGLSSARIPSAKPQPILTESAEGLDTVTSRQRHSAKALPDSIRNHAFGLSPLAATTQSEQLAGPAAATFDEMALRARSSAWLRPSNPPQRTSNSGDVKPSFEQGGSSAYIPLNRSLAGGNAGRLLTGVGLPVNSATLRSSDGGPNGTWPTRHSVAATAGSSTVAGSNMSQLVYFPQDEGARPHGQTLSPRMDLPQTNSAETTDPGTTPSARSVTTRVEGDGSSMSPKSPSGKAKGPTSRPSSSTGFNVLKALQLHQQQHQAMTTSQQNKQGQSNPSFPMESRPMNSSQLGCPVPLRGSGGGSLSTSILHDARASMPVPTVWSTTAKLGGFSDPSRLGEASRTDDPTRVNDSGRFASHQYLGYKHGRSMQDGGAEDTRVVQHHPFVDPRFFHSGQNDLGTDFFGGHSGEIEYGGHGGSGMIHLYGHEFHPQRSRQNESMGPLGNTPPAHQGNLSTLVHGNFQSVRSGLTRIRPADSAFHLMSLPLQGTDIVTSVSTRRRTDSGREGNSVPGVLPNGGEQESRPSNNSYDLGYALNPSGASQATAGPRNMLHNSPKNSREDNLPALQVRSTEAAPRRDGRLITGPGDGRDRRRRISSAHPPQRSDVAKGGKGATQRASHSLAPRQQVSQRRGRQNDARRVAQWVPAEGSHPARRHVVDFSY